MVVMLLGVPSLAATLGSSDGPAEVPPAAFKGRQYVDSKGCIYVRAGYDGTVTWVPRVTRDRKVICGYQPTFATAPAPTPKPAPEIVIVEAPPKPVANPVPVAVAPAPVVRPAAVAPVVAAPPPQVMVAPPVVETPRQPSPERIRRVLAATCPGLGANPERFAVRVDGYPVRCPPQASAPAPLRIEVTAAPPGPHADAPALPKGYKVAFQDDRLNPNRGPRTEAGDRQMARVLDTRSVPMRAATAKSRQAAGVADTVVVATKSDPGAGQPGALYVQAASFGVAANARTGAARLQAAGLPVRIIETRQAGQTMQIVLAGPFNSSGQVQSGLTATRRAGFRDAFLRR
jgi:hypothetical protein